MDIVEILTDHSEELGEGVDPVKVKDLEARLDIKLPKDFREYLIKLNYAEIFSDPIFGINKKGEMLDLYSQNKYKDHFDYGFLWVFSNDIDGEVYIRPDTGAVYLGFAKPVAKNFTEYVEMVLS